MIKGCDWFQNWLTLFNHYCLHISKKNKQLWYKKVLEKYCARGESHKEIIFGAILFQTYISQSVDFVSRVDLGTLLNRHNTLQMLK